MNNILRKILAVILPLVVIAAGIGVAVMLVRTRPTAQKKKPVHLATLVDAVATEKITEAVTVRANGIVRPARQVVLQSQVGGRLVWHHDHLVPGEFITEGQELFRLDARDFRLNVQAQDANLKRAQLELELEEGRQRVAEKEFALFGEEVPASEGGKRLAMHTPQIETARASVQSAQSGISIARLNLSRTAVTAPFNAVVQSETVEVGQVVQPQTQLATLIGTDAFWVQASVPMADLAWIDIPGVNAGQGSMARVHQNVAGQEVVREGRVLRLLAEVDRAGQMARLLIEVDDPYNLKVPDTGTGRGMPLLLDSFVDVEIQGHTLQEVVRVPRHALREGNLVYVYNDGKLDIRQLNVVWREPDHLLVDKGITAGELVVTSRISTPVAGMELRLPGTDTPPLEGAHAEGGDKP